MSKSKAVEFRELVDTREIADLSAVFDEIWLPVPDRLISARRCWLRFTTVVTTWWEPFPKAK